MNAPRGDEAKLAKRYPKLDSQQVAALVNAVASQVYMHMFRANIGTYCHAAIEWCALLSVYGQMLAEHASAGHDIRHVNGHGGSDALPMPKHRASYLGEKLHCILGPSLRAASEETRQAFIEALFGKTEGIRP